MQSVMVDLRSRECEFHGYQFSVEFVPAEDWKKLIGSNGRSSFVSEDLWCSQSYVLFLPLDEEITSICREHTAQQSEYVSWQLEQADDMFLLQVACQTFAWRNPLKDAIKRDVSELESQGLSRPQFMSLENIKETKSELGCQFIRHMRRKHPKCFYDSLADGCLNLINGFHVGLSTNPMGLGLTEALDLNENLRPSICVVGEGRITTAFLNHEIKRGNGLYSKTHSPRYVSIRNVDNVPKDIDKYLQAKSAASLSEFINFVEEQEKIWPSHGKPVMRSYSTWSTPEGKVRGNNPELTADLRAGRPVRYP